ncbi:PKD domain-containing protein, partial [Lentiprolixibacter aurantiacus]|uniref:PKD domain-containing protein n=1 Tax=Lentiprolixibacter aurantiacus TaxID=2993939 RepID=UPI00272950F1
MKQLLKTASKLSLILVLAFWACEEVESLLPTVFSNFTYTVEDGTGLVKFINTSEDATKYEWDFGDGTTSIEINPVKKYGSSGTYTVTLKAINASGASDMATDEVEVTVDVVDPPEPGDCTEETGQSLSAADFNLNFETDPGSAIVEDGTTFSRIANPDTGNDVNSSCFVGQIVRNPDLPFANNQIELDAKLDFNANEGFKLKVWAPAVGTPVLLKLEDKSNSNTFVEIGVETTTANAWEELTFDFAPGDSDKFDKIVLFFNINTNDGSTYYIDDLRLYGGAGGATCTAETEQSLNATDLNITFQTDPGTLIESYDANYSYVANPDFENTVNPSCQVGQIDRNGSALFANNQLVFDSKFDFNTNSGFKLKVWAPTAGTNVLLKLEDKTDAGINTEIGAVTTVASAWEELTFDFDAAESGKYDRIILFFELNTNTTETYYIDDLRLYSGGGGGTATEPTEAAPAPTQDAANVTSVFSNAYTNEAGTNPRAFG